MKQRSGAILAEACLGSFLIAVCLAVLAAGIQSWERMVSKTRARMGAQLVLRQEMERCLSVPYLEIDACDTGAVPLTETIERRIGKSTYNSVYELHVKVVEIPDRDLKRLRVRVNFGEDLEQKVELHSVLYKG